MKRAFVCAGGGAPRIDAHSAFETGSIARTMNAAPLAQFVLDGKVSPDTRLAALLPSSAIVPQLDGQSIVLRHVVTHRSGLPALPRHRPDLGRLLDELARRTAPPAEARLRWITAAIGDQVRLIALDDVIYFQVDDKCVRVATAGDDAPIRMPLEELLAGLDPDAFRQVHRGIVVRVAAIDRLRRDEFGKGWLSLSAGRSVCRPAPDSSAGFAACDCRLSAARCRTVRRARRR